MKNISETIKEAKSVALFLNKNSKENEALAREALGAAFRLEEIDVYFFPDAPKDIHAKWATAIPPHEKTELIYSTSIHIPKDRFDVKEITYDDNGKFFTLNVGSYNKHIGKQEVFFESKPAGVDVAFCFDPNGHEQIESLVQKDKTFSLSQEGASITKTVFDIIKQVTDKPLDNTPIPNLLFASLLLETGNFREKTNPDLLILAGTLLKLGANKKEIEGIINRDCPPSFPQLLGRALARTQTNKRLKSIWSFVSSQDLEKTSNQSAETSLFHKLTPAIRSFILPQPLLILLWQKKQEIWGLITPEDYQSQTFQKLIETIKGQPENGSFVTGPYKSFSEAEIKIQDALKKIG